MKIATVKLTTDQENRLSMRENAYYDGVNPRDVFASVTATMHAGPHYALTVESTSNGPGSGTVG